MSIAISTAAFSNGGEIPRQYTCSGQDISPPFHWNDVPDRTKSIALIADDPDAPAGTWTHWVIWNVPAHPAELREGIPTEKELKNGARQGMNDFNRIGYGGPCPPPGKPHRYFFKIYALDVVLDLKPGSNKGDLERAMRGHVLSEATWIGTFRR